MVLDENQEKYQKSTKWENSTDSLKFVFHGKLSELLSRKNSGVIIKEKGAASLKEVLFDKKS